MLLLAEAYLYDLDPVVLPIYGSFAIRWYGLAYAAGFVIGWLIIRWMARTGRSPLKVEQIGDLMTYVIVGVLLGGRLGWAIFYEGGRPLVEFSGDFPFWRLLAIMDGGMASHGGMIGVIVACWLWARSRGVSALHIMDLGAFTCAPGLSLGRVANFVNGELWGRALPAAMQDTAPWWSVKYAQEILLPGFAHLDVVEAKLRPLVGGDQVFLERVVEAAMAGNQQVVETLRPLLTAYYPSQIFQAVTDGPILMGALALIWLRPRKPGVVGGWFLIIYGLLRIASEQFRQPDEGVALLLGLSRGQVLSVAMVLAGVIGLPIVARRDVRRLGGLLRPARTP